MANNGPISVSTNGIALNAATGSQVTFNTKYPFHKLDSTKTASFQVIQLLLTQEPPNPTIGNSNTTVVYQFAHGYTYIPSTWFLVSIDNFKTVLGPEGVWLVGNATGTNTATAVLYITVDATNVYFTIAKSYISIAPPSVLGFVISVRAYIFVEDLTGTSLPSSA